jgi:3-isopropylmalate dehydrogenase
MYSESDRTTRRRTFVVACLAGHGIGPEVTAAASRALAQVSRQHGFRIDEVHPPFDGEGLMHAGHPLPFATRSAARAADAVLVAGTRAPALEGMKAELELDVVATRLISGTGGSTTVLAGLPGADETRAVDRAFAAARARGGRLAAVGVGGDWRRALERRADRNAGVEVTHLPLTEVLAALAAGERSLGVVVVEEPLFEAVRSAPSLGARRSTIAATGYLGSGGPGVFAPSHGAAHDIAGQGVANPSEMLLASALMLDEGLGCRAAAVSLEDSLTTTLQAGRATPDATRAGVGATTREFVDAVLALLPSTRRDMEFVMGVTS